MSILEKLQSDMEDDAYFNLPLEERYDLLKRYAETIAKRLDAVVEMLEPGDPPPSGVSERYSDMRCIGDLWEAVYEYKCEAHISAVAITEGRES